MPTRRLILLALAASAMLTGAARAADYPSRPVQYIVPFGAGGAAELASRVVTEGFTDVLGQPFVVENRPGANGIIGTVQGAKATPDGYTLLQANGATFSVNPLLYKAATYDPTKDFTPIGLVARQPYVIAVSAGLPVNTLDELIALAKQRDGKLTYATGSTSHQLAGELFQKEAGIKLTHVPYNATNLALPDVISGRVDLIVTAAYTAVPHLGKIRPIAATSAERAKLLPDVPTFRELGYPNFVVEGWFGVSAPAGLPPEVVKTLNAALNTHLQQEKVKETFDKAGFEVTPSTPEEFAAFIKRELETGRAVVDAAGIQPQ